MHCTTDTTELWITTLPEHFSSKCVESFVICTREVLLFWNFSLNSIALLSSSNKHSQDDHGVVCSSKSPETELCWTRRYLKSHMWSTEQKSKQKSLLSISRLIYRKPRSLTRLRNESVRRSHMVSSCNFISSLMTCRIFPFPINFAWVLP